MGLTRVTTPMLAGAIAGTRLVESPSQAAIQAACVAAGPGGSVYFPPGEYQVTDLSVDHANQTWELSPSAVIKRMGGGHALTLKAHGFRLYGGTLDVNSLAMPFATQQRWGIDGWNFNAGNGYGVEIDDLYLINGNSWGIVAARSPFIVRRLRTKDMGYAVILFASKEFRNSDQILVENCYVDSTGSNYHGQGGVLLRCDPANALAGGVIVDPKMMGNRVVLPQMTSADQAVNPSDLHTNSVLLELHNSVGPVVTGNTTSYGKIGISVNSAIGGSIMGNTVSAAFQYGIEIAAYNGGGSLGMSCIGNYVQDSNGQSGGSAAPSQGVSLSGGATKNMISGNIIRGCTQAVTENAPSSGNTIVNNITS